MFQTWEDAMDPTDWWISEKLDGVRAYWDGADFYSREGNPFPAPAWFKVKFIVYESLLDSLRLIIFFDFSYFHRIFE